MASAACIRPSPDSVQVHDNSSVDDLVISWNGHTKTEIFSHASQTNSVRPRLKRPQSTPNPSRRTSQPGSGDQTPKYWEWLSNKAVLNLQEKADPQVKKTKTMYESVLHEEDTFVKDLEDLVKHKDMLDLRKKELLHKNWNEHVHEPMRKQIVGQMTGLGYPELMRRKRELHKEYLEHVNKKGHVFLDTISPDEYYAMSLHPTRPSVLVAETKTLKDPLNGQERERNNEDRVIFRCENGSTPSDRALAQIRLPPLPLVPLGRHGTECSTWLEMPMGDIESPVRFASRNRMNPQGNSSQFHFGNWGKVADQSIVDEEFRIQKRQHSAVKSGNPLTGKTKSREAVSAI